MSKVFELLKGIIITLLLLLLFFSSALSQFNDNIWLLGYGGGTQSPGDSNFGISILDFSNNQLSLSNNQEIEMNFTGTNASICNDNGELLFYFNGVYVEDITYKKMLNGDTLNEWDSFGSNLPQGGLILPFPEHENQYMLLYGEEGYIDVPGWYLECVGIYYAIIDMDRNNGLGEVIARKIPLIIDTLEYGKITATKHANGRDWWIVINKSHSNKYYKCLLSNNGISLINQQEVGSYTPDGLGQSVFSPDGRYFVKFNATDEVTGIVVDIYSFDRCSGDLSNHKQIMFNDFSFSGGTAISRNSRVLYVMSSDFIYQFDLWSENIEDTKTVVAVYDSFADPFPTQFHQAQLALDGKIYFACKNGTKNLHIIHKPNLFGVDCDVEQHWIELPTHNASSIPNFPNYRLGPIDGSSCDTLDIDNIPLSRFRYDVDSIQPLIYHFTELANYEPSSWLWDFGNDFSTELNPTYEFPSPGIYNVCLTVQNEFGIDTECKEIFIQLTSDDNSLKVKNSCIIYPVPAHEYVTIELPIALKNNGELIIYNTFGILVKKFVVPAGLSRIDLDVKLLPNMLFVSLLKEENNIIYLGKFIKI